MKELELYRHVSDVDLLKQQVVELALHLDDDHALGVAGVLHVHHPRAGQVGEQQV